MQDGYRTRFAVLAECGYPGDGTSPPVADPHVFLFDIDACGFATLTGAAVFDSLAAVAFDVDAPRPGEIYFPVSPQQSRVQVVQGLVYRYRRDNLAAARTTGSTRAAARAIVRFSP